MLGAGKHARHEIRVGVALGTNQAIDDDLAVGIALVEGARAVVEVDAMGSRFGEGLSDIGKEGRWNRILQAVAHAAGPVRR